MVIACDIMENFILKKRDDGLEDFLVLCIQYGKCDPWIQLYIFWMLFLSMTFFFPFHCDNYSVIFIFDFLFDFFVLMN